MLAARFGLTSGHGGMVCIFRPPQEPQQSAQVPEKARGSLRGTDALDVSVVPVRPPLLVGQASAAGDGGYGVGDLMVMLGHDASNSISGSKRRLTLNRERQEVIGPAQRPRFRNGVEHALAVAFDPSSQLPSAMPAPDIAL